VSMAIKTFLVIAVLIGAPLIILAILWAGAHNSEVSLRNQFNGQAKVNESSFDKVWKILANNASVATTERESFRKTYTEIMQAQKGVAGNGQLASFLTQSKIEITPDLFRKLMNTIESQRESFHRDQQKLIDLKREHDDIRMRIPSTWFVGGRPELELKIVTSSKTDEAFTTGQDNNVDLFNKDSK